MVELLEDSFDGLWINSLRNFVSFENPDSKNKIKVNPDAIEAIIDALSDHKKSSDLV